MVVSEVGGNLSNSYQRNQEKTIGGVMLKLVLYRSSAVLLSEFLSLVSEESIESLISDNL